MRFKRPLLTLHVDVDVFDVFSLVVFQFDLIFAGQRVRGFFDVEYDFIVVDDGLDVLGGQRFAVFQDFRVDSRLSRTVDYKRKRKLNLNAVVVFDKKTVFVPLYGTSKLIGRDTGPSTFSSNKITGFSSPFFTSNRHSEVSSFDLHVIAPASPSSNLLNTN